VVAGLSPAPWNSSSRSRHGRLYKFPHNLQLVSVLYITERPEMAPHGGEPKKAKTTAGNKTYENKIS